MLEVSGVNIRLVDKPNNGLIGYASCNINNCIRISSIRIKRDDDGSLYLEWPFRTVRKDGEEDRHFEYFHPTNDEAEDILTNEILGKMEAGKG